MQYFGGFFQVAENTKKTPGNWSTLRIDSAVMDLLYEEQARLRKLEGKKPSYSQILRKMWDAYEAHKAAVPARAEPMSPMSQRRRAPEVEALIAWFENPPVEDGKLRDWIATRLGEIRTKPKPAKPDRAERLKA